VAKRLLESVKATSGNTLCFNFPFHYADDFVVCFEHERPATNFYKNLPNRFKGFGLEIAEEKTKKFLIFIY
jgi:hypothetical protein